LLARGRRRDDDLLVHGRRQAGDHEIDVIRVDDDPRVAVDPFVAEPLRDPGREGLADVCHGHQARTTLEPRVEVGKTRECRAVHARHRARADHPDAQLVHRPMAAPDEVGAAVII